MWILAEVIQKTVLLTTKPRVWHHAMMNIFSPGTAENTDDFTIGAIDQDERSNSIREFSQALDKDQAPVSYSSLLLFPAEQLGVVVVHSRG